MTNVLKKTAAQMRAAQVATAQTLPTPGRDDEVVNNAGGYVFAVDDKARLERFLIIGTDGGTYYQSEQDITKKNIKVLDKLVKANERLVIDVLKDVADNNRAAKNSPSLFALAYVMANGKDKAYLRTSGVFDSVVRTSTHLFELANYVDALGGWGRAKRDLIAGWYTGKDANQLAYQAVKYRQREGWTHRDLFRKVHPVGVDQNVGNFILGRSSEGVAVIEGFQRMQRATSAKEVIAILGEYKGLPWETIPTQFLNDPQVWKTLFYNGALGQTALLRNVTRLSKNGAFDDLVFAGDVAKALADSERIAKGRVHPVAYANGLGVYTKGRFDQRSTGWYNYGSRQRGWTVNAKVAGGMEEGFYNSFKTVKPANKATMVSIDVSGSMSSPAGGGLVGMTCAEAAAAMAMVVVRTEPYAVVNGFSHQLVDLGISATDSLETVVKKTSRHNFGSTDASKPMAEALRKNQGIDTFTVWTDNETWSGNQKPSQALKEYRSRTGREARLAVVAFTATDFTIADPKDRGMMDFVGFDASAPAVLADFSAGRI